MDRNRLWLFVALLLAAALSLCVVSCEGDDDDDDDDDEQGPPDALSSASPDVLSAQLDASHAGWGHADCAGCHGALHYNGFVDGECVTCHGSNGAPHRPAGHAMEGCAECHPASHAALDFNDPQQCAACHKFAPQSECPAVQDADVVVIGAGGGGLGAAATLALAGMDVVLIEKHYKVGGYMTTFRRGDYSFEASLHAMGGLDEGGGTRGMFEDLDIMQRLHPIKSSPNYRMIFPGVDISAPADFYEFRDLLIGRYPHEEQGIRDLFDDMQGCHDALNALTGLGGGFSIEALVRLMGELPYVVNLLRYMDMPLQEMVEQYVSDPELIGVFTQLVTYVAMGPSDLQALFFIVMWNSYHLEGFYYFEGGSASISQALAEVIEENGGRIRLNTTAERIVIQDNRAVQVCTAGGGCYNARYVISNANAWSTLLGMVGEQYLPADYVQRLKALTLSVPTLQVFLGVDHDYTDLFDGAHELMINASIDNDQNFTYIYSGDVEHVPFIITNYCESDPNMAPAGKNVISLTTYLPYELGDDWQWNEGHAQYDQYKQEVARVMIRRAEQYLPGLSEHIEVMEVGSPLTNQQFSYNPTGSIVGWANNTDQGTLRRLEQRTPIDNLFLAGAWTYPGGGQSAVIQSGTVAAGMILEDEAAR